MSPARSSAKTKRGYKKKDSLYKKPEVNEHRTLFSSESLGVNSGDNGHDADDGGNGNDAAPEHELGEFKLTPEAKADKFLTLWNKKVRPFRKYPGFRRMTDGIGTDEVFFQIKVWYKHFVNNDDWTEEKYEFVLDKILDAGSMFSRAAFNKYAFLYDHGKERASTRSSGTTSSIYEPVEKQAKITEVLSAWDALEALDDEDGWKK